MDLIVDCAKVDHASSPEPGPKLNSRLSPKKPKEDAQEDEEVDLSPIPIRFEDFKPDHSLLPESQTQNDLARDHSPPFASWVTKEGDGEEPPSPIVLAINRNTRRSALSSSPH